MDVALGFKAHSGWAALVALGEGPSLLERARIELAGEPWQKAPYHAADALPAGPARAKLVERGVAAVERIALREMRTLLERHRPVACAIVWGSPEPFPQWTAEQILAVHFRMHKAEGELFRGALARAAEACGLPVLRAPEKKLGPLPPRLAALGAAAGPPWGKDQKDAAHAAWRALQGAR